MARAAVIKGLGVHLPARVVTNDMLAQEVDTSDQWIFSRTGIRQRHIAAEGETTSHLAVHAARQALEMAGLSNVDAVLLSTTTPNEYCPGTAPRVASELGMAKIAAFDVSAACSGFVYGLSVANSMISAGLYRRILMIGSDTFSQTLDQNDRSTRALIGDGAGALVLEAGADDELGAIRHFDLGSDGEQVDLLYVPACKRAERGAGFSPSYFKMQGKAVFTQAVTRMTESILRVLEKTNWKPAEVDKLVPHQANARILTAVAEQLDFASDQLCSNIADVGNTVAASIPLALADACEKGRLTRGDKVVLTAFGAGLTWGSVSLVWPDIASDRN